MAEHADHLIAEDVLVDRPSELDTAMLSIDGVGTGHEVVFKGVNSKALSCYSADIGRMVDGSRRGEDKSKTAQVNGKMREPHDGCACQCAPLERVYRRWDTHFCNQAFVQCNEYLICGQVKAVFRVNEGQRPQEL